MYRLGFPGGSVVKNLPATQEPQETWVQSLGQEDPLEEGMATHSSILAWRIPWTEEPGRLQSIESQGWTRLKQLSTHTHTHVQVIFCLFVCQWTLGCFHVLTIVNNAAINKSVQIFIQILKRLLKR